MEDEDSVLPLEPMEQGQDTTGLNLGNEETKTVPLIPD